MAQIYFSNDLCQLALYLGNRLFSGPGKSFSCRTVIVPSDRYKRFLQQWFAENPRFEVAAGIQIMTLSTWTSQQCIKTLRKTFPSRILLEHRLYGLARDLELEPLKTLSDLQLKTVSRDLSHVFHQYGVYGEKFLKEWLKGKEWQQVLWRALYEQTAWSYSIEFFEKAPPLSSIVHLFGFSFMPTVQAQYFKAHGALFYLFSPCRLFWADLLGAKDRVNLHILDEDSTVLSYWGKWGKRLLNALSTEDMDTEEEYREPKTSHALGAVQMSLLDLTPLTFSVAENFMETIRIVSAKHRKQEIEELYEEIHRVLHAREDITPSDILILAPEIDPYVPYLHEVFGRKESDLDYTIRGMERGKTSLLAAGLQTVFQLIDQQWSLEALIQLFAHVLFAQKRGWKKTDLERIERWFSKAKVDWGFDGKQRQLYLHSKEVDGEAGTIRFAIDRLLFGLTSTKTENVPMPVSELEWTDVELFSQVIETVELLYNDLQITMGGAKQALHQWMDWLMGLMDRHFIQEEEPWLKEELLWIRGSCKEWGHQCFSWQDVRGICDDLFAQKKSAYQPQLLQSIQFDRLDEGMLIDKKVMMLIGMQESAFPRRDTSCSLNAMSPKAPSRGEIDRFLFLEAIMKAKDICFISFLHRCPERQMELSVSLVVQELQQFFEKSDRNITIQVLEERDFTQRALEQGPYFSHTRYRAADAYAHRQPNALRLVRDWHEEKPLSLPEISEDQEIDLADLRLLLKDPIEFYFRSTLKFKISWRDKCFFNEEEFFFSKSDRRKLLRKSMSMSLQEALREWTREKRAPVGAFNEVAVSKLQKEHLSFLEQLKSHSIHCESMETIHITPWAIDLDNGKKAILRGGIEDVSSQGIVELFEKNKKEETLLERWCDLLVLKGHSELQKFPSQLLFVQAKKEAAQSLHAIDPLVELKKIIGYYALCKQRLSPFLPQWAKLLLKGDKENLEQEFNSQYLSRYTQWLIQRDGLPNASVLCNTWSQYLSAIFESYAAI
ncbi:MAG: exodeoxyribonuclease V subunit gamma [Simkania sp.]|nr:exodeoxyribonuclease V subunit gamma [Simkania sp.]